MMVTLAVIVCLGYLCRKASAQSHAARAEGKHSVAKDWDDVAQFYAVTMFIVIGVFVLLGTIINPSFYGPQ